MLPAQGKARLRIVFEARSAKAAFRMTPCTILFERSPMRIAVARCARTKLQPDGGWRTHVTLRAGDALMPPDQRRSRLRVIERGDLPTRGRVAGLAIRADIRFVRISVAVAACIVAHSRVLPLSMALRAWDIAMRAVE